jgi:hypothetical protein
MGEWLWHSEGKLAPSSAVIVECYVKTSGEPISRMNPELEISRLNKRIDIQYRLCGLVVKVPGYRSRGATRFSEK